MNADLPSCDLSVRRAFRLALVVAVFAVGCDEPGAKCEEVANPFDGYPHSPLVHLPLDSSSPSLASFEAGFDCTGITTGAVDGGVAPLGTTRRREGCGQVVFVSEGNVPPRLYVFDATTDALVGRAQADDVTQTIQGCSSFGFAFGALPASCPDATETLCVPFP